MNDQPVASVEGQDREFEESTAPVEAQDRLFGGQVIVRFAGVGQFSAAYKMTVSLTPCL